MDIKETVAKIQHNIKYLQAHNLTCEEQVKQSLILPMLMQWGYDPTDPAQVIMELPSDDNNTRKGGKAESVDYGIAIDDKIEFFIEAKALNEDLTGHKGQLKRYYNANPGVKIAMLTNGIEWWLFTDGTNDNLMDDEPCEIINMEELNENAIGTLVSFSKENYNHKSAYEYAKAKARKQRVINSLTDPTVIEAAAKASGMDPASTSAIMSAIINQTQDEQKQNRTNNGGAAAAGQETQTQDNAVVPKKNIKEHRSAFKDCTEHFYITRKDNSGNEYMRAELTVEDGQFIVHKGALICDEIKPYIQDNVRARRDETKDIIINNILQEDQAFPTPSTAGGYVSGGAEDGWQVWRTAEGRKIDQVALEQYNKNQQ